MGNSGCKPLLAAVHVFCSAKVRQAVPVACHHRVLYDSLGEGAKVACLPGMGQVLFRLVDLLVRALHAGAQEAIRAAGDPVSPDAEGGQAKGYCWRARHCSNRFQSEDAIQHGQAA